MSRTHYESKLKTLADQAWDQEVRWPQIEAWAENFNGQLYDKNEEQLYGLFALSRFMYFSKRLVREMLKSLYRDHFESPLIQRIRRNCGNTKDIKVIRDIYNQELLATRFIGVGSPAESGAHLLYYFRQVNYLSKDLFVDYSGAFIPTVDSQSGKIKYNPKDSRVSRYVFFDDLVGSGTQVSRYLSNLNALRSENNNIEFRFLSLFATTEGLEKLNSTELFNGKAMCLFELDDSYKAFHMSSRYFSNSPEWFSQKRLQEITEIYGNKLQPQHALGYKNGQLLLGFTHNTPNNTLPIFWGEGHSVRWSPVFVRYDKK